MNSGNRLLDADVVKTAIGKLTAPQIATRKTWAAIPDDQLIMASMTQIHVVPVGSTTLTQVNPLDAGTTADSDPAWLVRPAHHGRLFRAGRI